MRARVRCSCALIAGLSMALSTSRNRSWAKPSGASSSSGPTRILACTASATRSGRSSRPLNVRARTSTRTPPRRRRRRRAWRGTLARGGPGVGRPPPAPRPARGPRRHRGPPGGHQTGQLAHEQRLPPARRTTSATPSVARRPSATASARSAASSSASPARVTTSTLLVSRTRGVGGVDVRKPPTINIRGRHATGRGRTAGPVSPRRPSGGRRARPPTRAPRPPDEQRADRVEQREPIDGPSPSPGRHRLEPSLGQWVGAVAELTQHSCPRPERWESSQHWPHATTTDRSARRRPARPGEPSCRSRFTRDQDDSASSGEGAVERGQEPSQRFVASDQALAATHGR